MCRADAPSCSRKFAAPRNNQGTDGESRWCVLRPRTRTASDPSIRSGDCPQTLPPVDRSTPQRPSEIRDGRSEALDIHRRPCLECARFSPAECARAEMAEVPLVPVGRKCSTTEFETLLEVLSAWLRPASEPKLDRDLTARGEIVRCANRSEYTEHRRRAGSRFFLYAVPAFLDRRGPQEMVHSLPSCIPRDQVRGSAKVFRRRW